MLAFVSTVFLSAFLLFQVQPLISRVILPWYGGTPQVWTTCMLFFQFLLLAGYCYAHVLQTLRVRTQAIVHIVLLAAGAIFCRIMPGDQWKPGETDDPTTSILRLLAFNVGVPYFLVSTTGPLLQSWFARLHPDVSPYRLYALSNLGSLLALVTYPAFVEVYLTLPWQTTSWSIGFVGFLILCAWSAYQVVQSGDADYRNDLSQLEDRRGTVDDTPSLGDHLLWILLAACGSTLFLSTTNQMLEDIAVVPFLYILPLGLYLLSFILCFDSNWWYVRPVWGFLLFVASIVAIHVHDEGADANIVLQVVAYSALVLTGCMVCHGELARIKPAPKYLTAFFLLLSTGGMLGGLFVGIVAPKTFPGHWEFPIAHTALYLLFAAVMVRLGKNKSAWHWIGYACVIGVGYHVIFNSGAYIGKSRDEGSEFRGRNFFGVVDVYKYGSGDEQRMYLTNGRIDHGFQYTADGKRLLKTSYYGQYSGLGLAVDWHPRNFANGKDQPRNMNIGVVGLGSGSSASYGKKGDVVRFYDINPMVKDIAETYFTYLKETPAKAEVVLGDARIAMERELKNGHKQNYDVIALDAFSSDAIPAHLLTRECMKVYIDHLRDPNEGIIAIHVSNRYLVLERICRKLAEELDMTAAKVENDADRDNGVYSATWVLLTKNKKFLEHEDVQPRLDSLDPKTWAVTEYPVGRVWTDDYYNLAEVVQWGLARREIRDFQVAISKGAIDKYVAVGRFFKELFRQPEVPFETGLRTWVKDYEDRIDKINLKERRAEYRTIEQAEKLADIEEKLAALEARKDLTDAEKKELKALRKQVSGGSNDDDE